MLELDDKQLLAAREESHLLMAVGEKNFKKMKLKTPLEFFMKKMNTSFEELGCIGYNPDLRELTAIVKIKKELGYSGTLCNQGSYEYVRFYLDYEDGNGWHDMGYVGVNVHDIPTKNDCDKMPEKPIDFAVRLKINPKQTECTVPNLPKVKAVLSWNSVPAPNDPTLINGNYYWGDVKEDRIQIKPKWHFVIPVFPNLDIFNLVEAAILNPQLSLKDIASSDINDLELLEEAKKAILPKKAEFSELAVLYKDKKVEPERFGNKLLKEAVFSPDPFITGNVFNLFEASKLSFADSVAQLKKTKCNTNYEEIFCIGADYNQEALVGTLRIKRPYGYNGNLCTSGSKEYVSFWIQEEDHCTWQPLGTASVAVHDIQNLPKDGLPYSVILPYDFSKYNEYCQKPQVLKIRAVLSWNTPPSGMQCASYGNVIESYIQIQPKIKWDKKSPKIITVGGISTSYIDNLSGLTIPGAKFVFNQTNTFNNSPFGGIIVVQGISAPLAGGNYKVKITNLTNNTSYYLNNNLTLLGSNNGVNSQIVHSPINDEYTYQPYHKNINNVLARFSPGNNDKLEITIENVSNSLTDSQVIQMDNAFPVVKMTIDDNGNCSHYPKGGTILGDFSVQDNYLENYAITTNVGIYSHVSGLPQSGTGTGTGKFDITTYTNKNCGSIYLKAIQKTIWNSVRTGTYRDIHKIVCLS